VKHNGNIGVVEAKSYLTVEGIGYNKELRSSLKLSQRQFARRIFVSQALMHEIELGKRKINARILHLIS